MIAKVPFVSVKFTVGLSFKYLTSITLVIVLTPTFSSTPPPVVYLTVNVSLFGASPYVLVDKKFVGSILDVVVLLKYSKPEPTFFGLGIISSSASLLIPDPNCSSVRKSALTLVVNRLGVFLNFRIYGTDALYCDKLGSL